MLDVWQGSEYTYGLLKLLCRVSKRDPKLISIDSELRVFPDSEVIHGSITFRLTKV